MAALREIIKRKSDSRGATITAVMGETTEIGLKWVIYSRTARHVVTESATHSVADSILS